MRSEAASDQASAAAEVDLLGHRFLLFTGKGGVGKSTLTAALAIEAAARGQRPLVVELGHRATMRSVFGVDAVGITPRPVGHGVHAMSVEFEQSVVEYMVQHIPSRRTARAIVGNPVLDRLFKAMPAVGEIATISILRQREAEVGEDGRPRWSPILVDLDATGHALMFLELREVVRHLMGAGPMRRLVDEMATLFADPKRTRLNLVTLPEELPVTETLELHERLQRTGSAAFGRIFVNRVPSTGLVGAEDQVQRLYDAAAQRGDHELLADASFARTALDNERRARAQVDRLRSELPLPIVELPRLSASRLTGDELRGLGRAALEPMAAKEADA